MNKNKVQQLVEECINLYLEANEIEAKLDKNTVLVGNNKILDSMDLVNIIVDIEAVFLEEGEEINLTSEVAMSARISPFRTMGSLCDFISQQIKDIE